MRSGLGCWRVPTDGTTGAVHEVQPHCRAEETPWDVNYSTAAAAVANEPFHTQQVTNWHISTLFLGRSADRDTKKKKLKGGCCGRDGSIKHIYCGKTAALCYINKKRDRVTKGMHSESKM